MRIAVLGTGGVGRTLAGKLADLGHEVTIGTRDPDALQARPDDDSFTAWHRDNSQVGAASFSEAADGAEIVFNATAGTASLDALAAAGAHNLSGKILVDVSNPLDTSGGFPPVLSVCNADSLGEQIQQAFPQARVVKTLNTVNASIMVDPAQVPGDHAMFVSGNDEEAKAEVTRLLKDGFGWREVIDLGDISSARGQEMYLPLWLRLMGALGDTRFNVVISR